MSGLYLLLTLAITAWCFDQAVTRRTKLATVISKLSGWAVHMGNVGLIRGVYAEIPLF